MRRILIAMQMLSGVGAVVLLALYVLGRAITDRTHITQYLYWAPWVGYVVGLICLGVMARLFAWRRRGRPARAKWTWRVPILAVPAILIHVFLADWRAWRYVAPPEPAPADKSLRVMHWNMTYAVPYWWDKYIAAVLKAPRPDVLIVTNPTWGSDMPALATALGPGYKAQRVGIFGVFTRLPIASANAALLNIPAHARSTAAPPGMQKPGETQPETDYLPEWSPIPRTGSNVYDPGHAACIRLDTTQRLGRQIVLWAVDMPSQPREWRMNQARAAARTLDNLCAAPPDSRDRFESPPDLIVGDFNTPRGSASLAVLSRGFPSAFSQAGRGPTASWPRAWPLLHIDHIFVGPSLRAASYTTMDLGMSEHWAQIAEIVTK